MVPPAKTAISRRLEEIYKAVQGADSKILVRTNGQIAELTRFQKFDWLLTKLAEFLDKDQTEKQVQAYIRVFIHLLKDDHTLAFAVQFDEAADLLTGGTGRFSWHKPKNYLA